MSRMSLYDWTAGLNPEQQQAVLHESGPLLILAGAGSGKTTVLVSRTGQLLQRGVVTADQMCILTFTNKAARELKHRVEAKLGAKAKGLWAGTFHQFGLQVLRQNHKAAGLPQGFGIIDQSDATAIIKELTSTIKNSAKDAFKPETFLSIMSKWRERGITKAQNDDEYEIMLEVLLPKYLKRLDNLGVVDFDGLLLKPLKLFKEDPKVLEQLQDRYQQVMVDEFQDTNLTQFQLVMGLSHKHQNLAVVGDDDQSIYGWRGACISNILDFPKRFDNCKVIRLERNYRSTPAILQLANTVIQKNENRHGKILRSQQTEQGSKPEFFVYDTEEIEAEEALRHIQYFKDEGFKYGEMAILYRSNSQAALVESQLRQNKIEYEISGGTGFFDRKETRDIIAYLKCATRPNEIAFRRILNTPSRGIGDTSLEKIQELAQTQHISFVAATKKWAEAGIQPSIGANIDAFFAMLSGLNFKLLSGEASVGENLLKFMQEIGYRDLIRTQSKDLEAFSKRWGVVEIFARVLDSFVERGGRTHDSIQDFIDAMELRESESDKKDEGEGKIQLMTLHACKGLEFDAVVLLGVEEDLIPHKTLGTDTSEERRLFYVGITRARQKLVLSRVRNRKRYGNWVPVSVSRFVAELGPEALTIYESGMRPVAADQKNAMLANFMANLGSKIAAQKIEVK